MRIRIIVSSRTAQPRPPKSTEIIERSVVFLFTYLYEYYIITLHIGTTYKYRIYQNIIRLTDRNENDRVTIQTTRTVVRYYFTYIML